MGMRFPLLPPNFYVSSTDLSVILSVRANAKKYIELVCCKCQKTFSKEKKEFDRQARNGRSDFRCSLKCCNETKEDSPFKLIWRNAKGNIRGHKFSLSIDYLRKLWDKQKGRCAYTGIPLVLPDYRYERSPRKASLDRIDSSRGYEEGNVEFVSVFVNLGKNGFDKQEIIELLNEFKNGAVVKSESHNNGIVE